MLTIEECAKNLGCDVNSDLANWGFKSQFLKGKFVEVKKDKFITVSENKELKSLDLEDDFGMIGEYVIAKNKARFKEILNSAITLEEAYNFSISK